MKTNGNDFTNPVSLPSAMYTCGLTKREFFAAMAMQGFIASEFYMSGKNVHETRTAEHAVSYADALIEELNKEVK